MSSIALHNAAECFEKEGYILLKELFSGKEIAELSTFLEDAKSHLESASSLNAQGLEFHSNLFKLNDDLPRFLSQKKLVEWIEMLARDKIWVRWDQQIYKSPGGVVFPWHRDNAYNRLKTEHYQFWIPITEMTQENGAIWVVPGSHRFPRIQHRKVGPHWVSDANDSNAICIEAQPGDVVIFSSRLLHKTGINQTDSARISYVIEYMRQRDLDPTVAAPYLFIDNHAPSWIDHHPKDNLFNRLRSVIASRNSGKERTV